MNRLISNSLKYIILLMVLSSSCKGPKSIYTFNKSIQVEKAAVVSGHPIASKIGIDILKQGGNAVDAAIAVQFALAVCYPVAGNIGGGGFMVFRNAQGEVNCLDFREMAPNKAHKDMYLDGLGNITANLSTRGHLAAGVPGTVDGMYEAYVQYSQLKNWKALLQPAIELADRGFKITKRQARMFNQEQEAFKQYNNHQPALVKNHPWSGGDLLMQKDLANTLSQIRDFGKEGFYSGAVADQIVISMKNNGGIIDHEDLKNYKSIWRKPIKCNYNGYEILSMPPPSSGGIALAQLFKMVEPYHLNDLGFHSAKAIHIMTEAERRVYADRSKHLGDPDFYDVPQQNLLDSIYLLNRMSTLDSTKASFSSDLDAGDFSESEQTTHFSIVDQYGNAVSLTTTINGGYGSKAFVEGAGFLLNNEMDDFSSKPGTPNLYGLIGAEANKIEPQKRMLSSMTPTIVVKDGKLKMIVGTPGGSTIITSVFQTIINKIDFNLSLKEAVHAPRFHHQWKPDELRIEAKNFDQQTKDELKTMGHQLILKGDIGKVEAIWINDDGSIDAVADWRADDHAEGY